MESKTIHGIKRLHKYCIKRVIYLVENQGNKQYG